MQSRTADYAVHVLEAARHRDRARLGGKLRQRRRHLQVPGQFGQQVGAGLRRKRRSQPEALRRLAGGQRFDPLADLAQHRPDREPAGKPGRTQIVAKRPVEREIERDTERFRTVIGFDENTRLFAPAGEPARHHRELRARQRKRSSEFKQQGHGVLTADARFLGFAEQPVLDQVARDAQRLGRDQYGVERAPELAIRRHAAQMAAQLLHAQAAQGAVRDLGGVRRDRRIPFETGTQAVQTGHRSGAPERAERILNALLGTRQRQGFVLVAAQTFAADGEQRAAQGGQRPETLIRRNTARVESLNLRDELGQHRRRVGLRLSGKPGRCTAGILKCSLSPRLDRRQGKPGHRHPRME